MASLPPDERQDLESASPGAHAPPEPFPWPPPPGLSALDALAQTWRHATFEPRAFFDAMPRATGYGAALLYYLVIGVAAAGVGLFWRSLGGPFATERAVALRALGMSGADTAPLLEFLFSPLLLLVMIVLAAGTTHIVLTVLGGARAGFRTTAKVFAFAYSPQIFVAVPIAGPVVAFPWMVVLAMIGLRHAHETDRWRAALAVLLPLIALVTIYAIVILAALGNMILG